MLSLVIRNLVSNALKFSYPGDSILISANIVNGQVAISISDTGSGMSSATITNINHASPHSLTSTYGTAKEKGTGLGLVLCKNFLDMMSGKLIAKPNDPKGTVMVIYIPCA
jgi:signal transduction histidine kinase